MVDKEFHRTFVDKDVEVEGLSLTKAKWRPSGHGKFVDVFDVVVQVFGPLFPVFIGDQLCRMNACPMAKLRDAALGTVHDGLASFQVQINQAAFAQVVVEFKAGNLVLVRSDVGL